MDLFVEVFAESRDRRPGKLPAAELGRDLLDAARGNALHHHLHQRKDQCLLGPLVPVEEGGL
jgi:hypothetical protein